MSNRTGNAAGFTLVEVALAVLVVAMGVLAVFGLLAAGLDQSRKAIADTEAAIFAKDVFCGLRAISDNCSDAQTDTNHPWEDFWESAATTGVSIRAASADLWVGPIVGATTNDMLIHIDGTMHTNEYRNYSFRTMSAGDITNHMLRYQVDVSLLHDAGTMWTNKAMVFLRVWRGKWGSTNDFCQFYSEFDNPGDL